MIRLTRLNRMPLVLNSDLIEHIDVTPDTVITLTTGQILRVRESAEEVIRRIIGFRRQIFGPEGPPPGPADEIFPEEAGPGIAPVFLIDRPAPYEASAAGAQGESREPRD